LPIAARAPHVDRAARNLRAALKRPGDMPWCQRTTK